MSHIIHLNISNPTVHLTKCTTIHYEEQQAHPKHPSPSTLPPAAAAVAAVDTAGTPTLPTAADAAEVVDTARATTLPTAAAEAPHSNPPIDSAQRRRKISNYSNTKAYNCNLSVDKSKFAELGIKL